MICCELWISELLVLPGEGLSGARFDILILSPAYYGRAGEPAAGLSVVYGDPGRVCSSPEDFAAVSFKI